MKLLISSIFLAFLLSCTGCLEKNLPQKEEDGVVVLISPMILPNDNGSKGDNACKDYAPYNKYYELYIDDKLIYRNRLRTTHEKEQPIQWQMNLGQHRIKIIAEGFNPFEGQVEIVDKKIDSVTTQYFGVILTQKEQDKKKDTSQ